VRDVTAPPDGISIGHWTDRRRMTGCTVILAPDGAVAAGEVRGGGPGTRETDLLSPASGARLVQALLFTGGSAFGLAAADGVASWLAERGHGHETRLGVRVPLVPAAVVFDLARGDADARPGPIEGYEACQAARRREPERGGVGAGTGCAAGKLLGPEGWTPTGVGWAGDHVHGARVCVLAVVNPVGEVVDEDGSILAGTSRDGAPVRTAQLLREGVAPLPAREATTLVAVLTDADLDKTQAWLVARSASAGVARAVHPCATPFDGDAAFCLATGRCPCDATALAAVVQDITAAAIRDGARAAAAAAAPASPAAA
jgi:L-aminopeptidase/D-esterase-like protein